MQAEGPRQQVEMGFAAYFRLVVSHEAEFRLLYGRDHADDQELGRALRTVEDAIAEAIDPLIDAGLDDDHRRLLAYGIVGMAEGASRRFMAQRPDSEAGRGGGQRLAAAWPTWRGPACAPSTPTEWAGTVPRDLQQGDERPGRAPTARPRRPHRRPPRAPPGRGRPRRRRARRRPGRGATRSARSAAAAAGAHSRRMVAVLAAASGNWRRTKRTWSASMTTTSCGVDQIDPVHLAAAVPPEVGVGELRKAGQCGPGAHAHRLAVDGVGARR